MSFSRQEKFLTTGRHNQKQRTRQALLDAAITLAKEGRQPSIAEVADAARVSPATAYRYFPNPQSLWADLATQQRTRRDDFTGIVDELTGTAEERVETVVRSTSQIQLADEALWRNVLRATLDRWFEQADMPESERVPIRGITRLQMTRTALEPLSDRLTPEHLDRLANAIAIVFGVEAIVSTRDTCGLSPEAAVDLMAWSAQALVRQALAEAEGHHTD